MSTAPVYMLAFDHRQVLRDMLGKDDEDEAAERSRLSTGKTLVVEALELMVEQGADNVGILVDEEYGADAAHRAKQHGITLAMPVEASRTQILEFQYGADFPAHVERFRPDIVKILVFHNPDDGQQRKSIQIQRTREACEWSKRNGFQFMLEMLVLPSPAQDASVDGDRARFWAELHTGLLRSSMQEYQTAGIDPDIWKVEGLPSREDFAVISQQARQGGRDDTSLIVLGNGADLARVEEWLSTAASVDGFTGFAVGRSIWFEPLKAFYFEGLSREETRRRIATSFARLVRAFQGAQ